MSLLGLVSEKHSENADLFTTYLILMATWLMMPLTLLFAQVQYVTIDAAVVMLRSLGLAALMAKGDIKPAFRLLRVHPEDVNLPGFIFQQHYCYDKALPVSCSFSSSAFERLSTFLHWCVATRAHRNNMHHHLDYFLIPGRAGDK